MRFSKAVVKFRAPILIITLLLMIPAVFGMAGTRINYDMLDYLPDDFDTTIGQAELTKDFGKGAFSLIIVEDMSDKDVKKLCERIEGVEHVDSVLWYSTLADITVPKELLPDRIYNEFNTDHSTMLAVFFDSATSADVTMDAIREIRSMAGKQCFVSGMSALVTDLKDLCEKEEPIYVGLAVAFATLAMLILLDSWLAPFVFLASIGMMILLNLGTNYFFGEISYITKALAAVLQLAVTMDYSIFLWHSYNEKRALCGDPKEAMAQAIRETLASVVGSSVTTVAGFAALCFMTFTLGLDLGIVMAKGVVLGVIGCVTVLPSLILLLDKPLEKTKHKSLIPDMGRLSKRLVKIFPVFIAVFLLLIPPAYYGYRKTNAEVYYDMGQCLPEDIEYVIANSKLSEDFNIASTHMVLLDSGLEDYRVHSMINEMEEVDGVKYVLGLESVIGSRVPEDIIPEKLRSVLESDKYELRKPERHSEKIRRQRDAYRRGALHEGYDRNDRPRLQGSKRRFHTCDIHYYRACGKEHHTSLPAYRRHRACDIHQSRFAALFRAIASVYRSDLHQHYTARRNRRLRDTYDNALQIRKDRGKRQA